MPAKATTRQMEAFLAICRFREEKGCTPTTRELGSLLGIEQSGAHRLMQALLRSGLLTKTGERGWRSLTPSRPMLLWRLVNDPALLVLARSRTEAQAVSGLSGEFEIASRLEAPAVVAR